MMQPGEIQLLNNHTALHARSEFEDYEDVDSDAICSGELDLLVAGRCLCAVLLQTILNGRPAPDAAPPCMSG